MQRFQDNNLIPAAIIATKFKEAGNTEIISGDIKSGRQNLRTSLRRHFSFSTLILLIWSLPGARFYRVMIWLAKKGRVRFYYRARVQAALKKYPDLYQAARAITKNYKNW